MFGQSSGFWSEFMIRGVTGSMTVPRLYNPLTALYLGLLSWYDL